MTFIDRLHFDDYPDVLSVNDLSSLLHIGKNKAYALVKNDSIKNIKIGKIYKIPKCYVIDFLTTQS